MMAKRSGFCPVSMRTPLLCKPGGPGSRWRSGPKRRKFSGRHGLKEPEISAISPLTTSGGILAWVHSVTGCRVCICQAPGPSPQAVELQTTLPTAIGCAGPLVRHPPRIRSDRTGPGSCHLYHKRVNNRDPVCLKPVHPHQGRDGLFQRNRIPQQKLWGKFSRLDHLPQRRIPVGLNTVAAV